MKKTKKAVNVSVTSKYKDFIPAVVLIAIGIVLAVFTINKVMGIPKLRAEHKKQESSVANLQKQVQKLVALEQGELSRLESVVNRALPNDKPIFESLRSINYLAEASGVEVINLESRPGSVASGSAVISTASRRSQKDYETLSLSFDISGEFDAVNQFIQGMLQLSPLMQLKTVRISSSAANMIRGEIDLDVYWKDVVAPTTKNSSNSKAVLELSQEHLETLTELENLNSR